MMNRNLDQNMHMPEGRQPYGQAVAGGGGMTPSPAGQAVPGEQACFDDEDAFNLQHLWETILNYRWLIVSFLMLGLVAGFLVTFAMPPKYRAEAMIKIMPPAVVVNDEQAPVFQQDNEKTYHTALTELKSLEMMRRVARELGLSENKAFLLSSKGLSIGQIIRNILGHSSDQTFETLNAQERERLAVAILRKNLSARLIRRTRIIQIHYVSSDPQLASRIANQFAESFITQWVERSLEPLRLERQFIAKQIQEVKKKREQAEKILADYVKNADPFLTQAKGDKSHENNIKAMSKALAEAVQERQKYERLINRINAGEVKSLEEAVAGDLRELEIQGNATRKLKDSDTQTILNIIQKKYQSALRRERDLRRKLEDLTKQQFPFQYSLLENEVTSYRYQYQTLIDKFNRLNMLIETLENDNSIIQHAMTPNTPYSPKLSKNLAIALALSLVAVVGVIYIREATRNTYERPDQLEKDLKLPVLGLLPEVPKGKLPEALANPCSSLSEAYHTLRASLQFTGRDGAPKSLLVTSAEPREGKSTVAAKLAEEFGAIGSKVLLVDANLRKPMLHRLANISNTPGLSDLLSAAQPVPSNLEEDLEIVRDTPWPNVRMVTAGSLPPNPANVLASPKMNAFIKAGSQQFDIIIIDAPPVIGLADALLLSHLAEGTLFVVAAGQAKRETIQTAVRRVQMATSLVVGAALNRFKLNKVKNPEFCFEYGCPPAKTTANRQGV